MLSPEARERARTDKAAKEALKLELEAEKRKQVEFNVPL